jgi:hypothetical protein
MLRILNFMPLMIIVVLMYFVGTFAGQVGVWDKVAFEVNMISGAIWQVTWGTILLTIGLVALYIEVSLSARSSAAQIVNHIFSMIIFIASLVLFFIVPQAGTSEFFLLIMMMFVDVVAGFTISIRAARRDFGGADHLVH